MRTPVTHGHGHTPHESPWVMLVPLIVLALGAVAAGFVFQQYFIGTGTTARRIPTRRSGRKAIFEGENNHILHAHARRSGVGAAGRRSSRWRSGSRWPGSTISRCRALPAATARAFRPIYLFLLNKWYFDELYDWIFVRPAMWHRTGAVEEW